MTCRHGPGDPNCSSNRPQYYEDTTKISALEKRIRELESELAGDNPDNRRFEIEDVREVGKHLVLKVRYPNCKKCSYEGVKVLVYLNQSIVNAIKWRIIDPHFSDKPAGDRCAPSPAARFPASEEGWKNALRFANTTSGSES